MKKVRYLIGAAGVAPAALGLLAQAPPTAAATHAPATRTPATHAAKPRKTVYFHTDSGCAGSVHRQHTVYSSQKKNFIVLGFWSEHHNSKTCIGTIYVNAGGSINYVDGFVSGRDGDIYCGHAGTPKIEWGCHGSFYNPFSVHAVGSTNGGAGGGFFLRVGSRVG